MDIHGIHGIHGYSCFHGYYGIHGYSWLLMDIHGELDSIQLTECTNCTSIKYN